MKISIGFFTGRKEPRLDWLLEAIERQVEPEDELEIIVVDALARGSTTLDRHDGGIVTTSGDLKPDTLAERMAAVIRVLSERELAIVSRVPQIKRLMLVPPKPNIWQGQYRITSTDWWAMSNSRNTLFCLAQHDYVVGLDDRAKPGDKWLSTIRRGERQRASVLAGSYSKLEGPYDKRILVDDHRHARCPQGMIDCGGSWLYGCTFALPLEWALEVNGFEEGCDSLTGEDYIFGMMLHNARRRIDFVPELYVELDREPGDASMKGKFACTDKGVSPNDKSHAAVKRFGRRTRTELTPDLREIRVRLARGEGFPVPSPDAVYLDWFDGQPIREMTPR